MYSKDEVKVVMVSSMVDVGENEPSNGGNEMYAGRDSDCFDSVMLGFGVGNVRRQ